MSNTTELIERLNETVRMQSSIIDDLFQLLAQHTAVEEMEKTLKDIRDVARRCKELDERQEGELWRR